MRNLLMVTLAVCGYCGVASAATITETYNFVLSNFVNYDGTDPSPVTNISGGVTVTFNPAVTRFDVRTGISLDYLSGISLGSALGFTSFHTDDGRQLLYFGGIENGSGAIGDATNDLVVALDVTIPDAPVLLQCSDIHEACGNAAEMVYGSGYAVSSLNDIYGAVNASVSVPEPASLSLLGLGVGVVVTARRRRR